MIEGKTWSVFPTVCGESVVSTVVPEDQSLNLWRVGLDGSGLTRLTSGSIDYLATCTHDDPTVLYTSLESGSPAIWKSSIEGGEAEMLSVSGAPMERSPKLSPDGRYLAFELFDPEAGRWVGAVAEWESQQIVLRIEELQSQALWKWHPDSSGVALGLFKEGVEDVYLFPIDGSEPQQITEFTNDERIRHFDWLPDGKSLILSRGTSSRDVVLITDFR